MKWLKQIIIWDFFGKRKILIIRIRYVTYCLNNGYSFRKNRKDDNFENGWSKVVGYRMMNMLSKM